MSKIDLVAGKLSKMVHLPFGRSRWITRYFVLLDSELRFYKDEHSENALQILNLRQIHQIVPAPTSQHPYCFRLEPKEKSMRSWIIDCKSDVNMELWLTGIQSRITKFDQELPLSPTTTFHSVQSMVIVSPDVYRLPTQPLRCVNETKESLLTRRNKTLPPIITTATHDNINDISPASNSSVLIPSPTGAVLGYGHILDTFNTTKKEYKKNISLESYSPTFLMYKKKFLL